MKANSYGKREGVLMQFYMAVKSYLVEDFDDHMHELEKFDINAAQYVRECDPSRWAHCHFQGRRYNIMAINIAECMNALLKNGREMPIIPLIDYILDLMRRCFFQRRKIGELLEKPVTK